MKNLDIDSIFFKRKTWFVRVQVKIKENKYYFINKKININNILLFLIYENID